MFQFSKANIFVPGIVPWVSFLLISEISPLSLKVYIPVASYVNTPLDIATDLSVVHCEQNDFSTNDEYQMIPSASYRRDIGGKKSDKCSVGRLYYYLNLYLYNVQRITEKMVIIFVILINLASSNS